MDGARANLINVLREARGVLARPGNDFAWSPWESQTEALSEMDGHLANLERGVLPEELKLWVLFAPTGHIQEVSVSSGWGQEFLDLSERFDAAMARLYGPSLSDVLSNWLTSHPSPGPNVSVWERKTFNMHRGVIVWKPTANLPLVEQLGTEVRQQVRQHFKISWWRGFAFGAVLQVADVPRDVHFLDAFIDVRNNSKGTWQWVILACPSQQLAIGCHTWIEGYLAPAYRALLDVYSKAGWQVGSVKKDKGALMKFLTTVSSLHGYSFPEFKQ